MPFPHTERLIFRNNPLVEVICQLRFPTVLEILAEQPAKFQNLIRATYPIYNRDEGAIQGPPGVDVSGLLQNLKLPGVGSLISQSLTHKFSTKDERHVISLNSNFVAVADYDYDRWENLRLQIDRAKSSLEEVYSPAFYSRIGLRYINKIDREELKLDAPWHLLINPALIGILGEPAIRDEVRENSVVSLLQLESIEGGLIRLRHGLNQSDGHMTYVLDADMYIQEGSETNEVIPILDEFRRTAGDLFRWAATDTLREALEPLESE